MLWLAAVPLMAQETPVFRTETSLALVRFNVVRKQQYVDRLQPGDIVLLEDGEARPFTLFEGGLSARRTVPVEMTLLFDTSGSVTEAGLLNPLVFKESVLDGLENVSVAVLGFETGLRRYCAPTRDFETLKAALSALTARDKSAPKMPLTLPPKRRADPNGGTWLYEAVAGAAAQAGATPGNATRLLLVFSDGLPTTTTTPEDASGICRELGIAVYPVLLGHQLLRQARSLDERNPASLSYTIKENQMADFARLGELTGGRSFDPPEISLAVMRSVLSIMVAQIRMEYVVGFQPEVGSGPPQRHRLEVRLRDRQAGRVIGGTRTVVH